MKVQAEISLYPLHCSDLTEPIWRFAESLKANNLKVEIGPMSTLISGDSQVVFKNLNKAFETLAAEYQVVMTAKISNACPEVGDDREVIMNKQRGFTLIELLVVIAIIAVLLAILMPALQRIKEQAREMSYRASLRQYGVVQMMYLDDHDDRYPSAWRSMVANEHPVGGYQWPHS